MIPPRLILSLLAPPRQTILVRKQIRAADPGVNGTHMHLQPLKLPTIHSCKEPAKLLHLCRSGFDAPKHAMTDMDHWIRSAVRALTFKCCSCVFESIIVCRRRCVTKRSRYFDCRHTSMKLRLQTRRLLVGPLLYFIASQKRPGIAGNLCIQEALTRRIHSMAYPSCANVLKRLHIH